MSLCLRVSVVFYFWVPAFVGRTKKGAGRTNRGPIKITIHKAVDMCVKSSSCIISHLSAPCRRLQEKSRV